MDFSNLIFLVIFRPSPRQESSGKARDYFVLWLLTRLFTVLYLSVRSSRSSALRYVLPSCMSVKTAIIPDTCPLGTIAVTVRRGISKWSHEKIGDCEQSTYWLFTDLTMTHKWRQNCLLKYRPPSQTKLKNKKTLLNHYWWWKLVSYFARGRKLENKCYIIYYFFNFTSGKLKNTKRKTRWPFEFQPLQAGCETIMY